MTPKYRWSIVSLCVVSSLSVAGVAFGSATVEWLSKNRQNEYPLVGGYEPGRALVVCRASHEGGVHPGKVVNNRCNFGYGGQEITSNNYRVLRIRGFYNWVPATGGQVPPGAVVGGQEPGRQLYICRAMHAGGLHPGKIVGNSCNFSYGGTELTRTQYEVLVTPAY